jgi:glycosyltransferase involved in cell wall biosynthesis
MRIVWILTACGLVGNVITGGPVRFHSVSQRWAKKQGCDDQVVLTTSGGKELIGSMGSTLSMQILPASLLVKKEPFKAFRLYSYFITAISSRLRAKKLPIGDVVITVSDYFCDIIPAILMKRKNPQTKWVAWIHHRETHPKYRPGNPLVNQLMYFLQGWSFKKIARYADEALVYTTDSGDSVCEELLRYGMQNCYINRMKCGIEIKSVPREDISKCVDAVVVGVRPNKGMYDIVPVWKEVQRLRPGTTLRLMGGMVNTAQLEDDIKNSDLVELISIFKYEGVMDTRHYYKTLKEARIMFAPSREEGWGIAVCEAMACGLPVVGYDLPVYKRIYGDSFVKIPVGDTAAFAANICKILDSKVEFESFQKKGLDCAKQYDWDSVADEDWAYLNAVIMKENRNNS